MLPCHGNSLSQHPKFSVFKQVILYLRLLLRIEEALGNKVWLPVFLLANLGWYRIRIYGINIIGDSPNLEVLKVHFIYINDTGPLVWNALASSALFTLIQDLII